MTRQPTGRRETRNERQNLVLERTFHAPITSVWAAVTDSARLERWIGTWSGDPSSGSVEFRMTAEGDDVDAETFVIHACEAPRLLAGPPAATARATTSTCGSNSPRRPAPPRWSSASR